MRCEYALCFDCTKGAHAVISYSKWPPIKRKRWIIDVRLMGEKNFFFITHKKIYSITTHLPLLPILFLLLEIRQGKVINKLK